MKLGIIFVSGLLSLGSNFIKNNKEQAFGELSSMKIVLNQGLPYVKINMGNDE
jgi:hypothetical protein